MLIMMFTNTFTPHVGGVARSVSRLSASLRACGHRVVIVAPEFEDMPEDEEDVIRVPAVQKFNGSDFALTLPLLSFEDRLPEDFRPDIIHAHHPYLLGDTALKLGARYGCPVVFTHHTMYEQYTHYVPGDSENLKRFVVELSTGFANMCDLVIAPSQSVAEIIAERGVETRIEVVPTGLDIKEFCRGEGARLRDRLGIAADTPFVGHVGRLAPEKNLEFLMRAVGRYLRTNTAAHFLVVGDGSSREKMAAIAGQDGVADRTHFTGKLSGQELADAYHAIDVFAFSSKSETQGMVLTEAMAAGSPVVALDASGVREVLIDGENGRMLAGENEEQFADALAWTFDRLRDNPRAFDDALARVVQEYSLDNTTRKVLDVYASLLDHVATEPGYDEDRWQQMLHVISQEWDIWANRVDALATALLSTDEEKDTQE